LIYTLALVIIGDFASFFVHWLMHKIPVLWEFHKIHHSATTLNPFTQYRLHPVEIILNNAKAILIIGLITGFFDYFSNNLLSKHTIIGVNIFNFLFLVFGANLRHSHVPFKYFNFLEYFLISPYQHQIHHSNNPADFDKNMGAKLAIWDSLFGTLKRSEEVTSVQFGLGLGDDKNYDTLGKNLWMPFRNTYKKLIYLVKKI
ncbi:MAG: sterol desaturase, partial [Flavobacteriaceae bacterium]